MKNVKKRIYIHSTFTLYKFIVRLGYRWYIFCKTWHFLARPILFWAWSQVSKGWKTVKSKFWRFKRKRISAIAIASPLFSPHSIIKWSTSTLSVARLTIPDGKLQLYVIPFYTRQNPLVSVQNVFARTHIHSYLCTWKRIYLTLIPVSTFNDKSSRIATTKTRYSQIEVDPSSFEKDIESKKI